MSRFLPGDHNINVIHTNALAAADRGEFSAAIVGMNNAVITLDSEPDPGRLALQVQRAELLRDVGIVTLRQTLSGYHAGSMDGDRVARGFDNARNAVADASGELEGLFRTRRGPVSGSRERFVSARQRRDAISVHAGTLTAYHAVLLAEHAVAGRISPDEPMPDDVRDDLQDLGMAFDLAKTGADTRVAARTAMIAARTVVLMGEPKERLVPWFSRAASAIASSAQPGRYGGAQAAGQVWRAIPQLRSHQAALEAAINPQTVH